MPLLAFSSTASPAARFRVKPRRRRVHGRRDRRGVLGIRGNQVHRVQTRRAGARCNLGGQCADAEQPIDAGGIPSHLRMGGWAVGCPTRTCRPSTAIRRPGTDAERSVSRATFIEDGVGVVGVIEQQAAARKRLEPHAMRRGLERRADPRQAVAGSTSERLGRRERGAEREIDGARRTGYVNGVAESSRHRCARGSPVAR